MKKFFYYILNLTFHNFDNDIVHFLSKIRSPIIFDVGCYRGVFSKKILNKIKNKKSSYKFYLFDVNKNVKNYLKDLINKKNFIYNEIALSNKNGRANYYYNSFFESSGSSLSKLTKNDKKWVISRKIILKIFFQQVGSFLKLTVPTTSLDTFIQKNKIKKIDVLKIDVDGSEKDVLNGAKKAFKNNKVKIILLEIATKKREFNNSEASIISFLEKRNFKFLKKYIMLSPSLFSNIKAGDYLFLNKKFFKLNA